MKRGRIIIFTLAGVCLIIGVAITFVVYEVLFVAGAISETKKLHSFRLDTDVVADVYLVRHFENYECAFEVRTNNHRIAIPKTQFRGEHYWGSVVAGRTNSWEMRARFSAMVGRRSRVAGIVAEWEPKIVLVLIDLNNFKFFNAYDSYISSYSASEEEMRDKLLARLQADFPSKPLAFDHTDKAFQMRSGGSSQSQGR